MLFLCTFILLVRKLKENGKSYVVFKVFQTFYVHSIRPYSCYPKRTPHNHGYRCDPKDLSIFATDNSIEDDDAGKNTI